MSVYSFADWVDNTFSCDPKKIFLRSEVTEDGKNTLVVEEHGRFWSWVRKVNLTMASIFDSNAISQDPYHLKTIFTGAEITPETSIHDLSVHVRNSTVFTLNLLTNIANSDLRTTILFTNKDILAYFQVLKALDVDLESDLSTLAHSALKDELKTSGLDNINTGKVANLLYLLHPKIKEFFKSEDFSIDKQQDLKAIISLSHQLSDDKYLFLVSALFRPKFKLTRKHLEQIHQLDDGLINWPWVFKKQKCLDLLLAYPKEVQVEAAELLSIIAIRHKRSPLKVYQQLLPASQDVNALRKHAQMQEGSLQNMQHTLEENILEENGITEEVITAAQQKYPRLLELTQMEQVVVVNRIEEFEKDSKDLQKTEATFQTTIALLADKKITIEDFPIVYSRRL